MDNTKSSPHKNLSEQLQAEVMNEYENDEFEPVTPSSQISEVPFIEQNYKLKEPFILGREIKKSQIK